MTPTDDGGSGGDRSNESGDRGRTPRDSRSSSDSAYSREFAEAVGRTIKVIRTDLGIERRELAAKVGISYSYLTEIENGNKPASSTVLRPLAHALGLRLSQLTEAAEHRLDVSADSQGVESSFAAPYVEPQLERQVSYNLLMSPSTPRSSPRSASPQQWAMQPSLRGKDRELRGAIIELESLLRHMAPDDIGRLLDYARRLAR